MSLVADLRPEVRRLFETAGWVDPHEANGTDLQARIFEEVGGLSVGRTGAGVECAASNIQFFRQARADRASFLTTLFPNIGPVVAFADAHNQHVMLFLDAGGRFLAYTDPDSQLYVVGETFAQCVERLLLGYRWNAPFGA